VPNTLGVTGTTDRLIFASDQSANLATFDFTGYLGATQFALAGGFYEITPVSPVPEPSTYFAALLGFATVAVHQRKRLTRLLRR
jgi:hypothetical protein